jgi:hypothetical protein
MLVSSHNPPGGIRRPVELIFAGIVVCPSAVSEKLGCLVNTSWWSNQGFSTSLKTSHRRATVACSRTNGTILKHNFSKHTPTVRVPVPAPDLLQVFKTVLERSNHDGPFGAALALLGVANNTASLPVYAWWYFTVSLRWRRKIPVH